MSVSQRERHIYKFQKSTYISQKESLGLCYIDLDI